MVKVEDPAAAMLAGLREHVVAPSDEDTLQVSVTVPENPFTTLVVIVDVPVPPLLRVKLVGLAVTWKSPLCADPQAAMRAPASNEPSPLAKSYPVPAA
jgi:hypothetical protein